MLPNQKHLLLYRSMKGDTMSKIMKTTKTTMNSVMNNNNTMEVNDMRIEMYKTNSM